MRVGHAVCIVGKVEHLPVDCAGIDSRRATIGIGRNDQSEAPKIVIHCTVGLQLFPIIAPRFTALLDAEHKRGGFLHVPRWFGRFEAL